MQTTPHASPAVQPQSVPTAPSTLQRWFPAGVWLRSYAWTTYFRRDLIAAISVAALLIPESMGYATVAGVPVQIGLYAAPLALIGYALFGGSRLLVFATAGSVAAVSGSVVGMLSDGDPGTAVTLTIALALTTGVVFIVAGLARMGWVTNFISTAVMDGFIIGLAIHIIVGQLGKLLGVELVDGNTFERLWSVIFQFGEWNRAAAAIGFGAILLIFALRRFLPKLPAALTAVVLSSMIVAFAHPELDLVAHVPHGLPAFTIPTDIDRSTWLDLLAGGAVVALVGFSEGWGASASIARKTHDALDTNQEFRAYGFGNIGAGLLGGMAVAGSLSKSSAAIEAGAETQLSNIFLAGIVLLTLAFFAPLFQWLPEAVLAAIVIHAMWDSANPRKLTRLWHIDRVDLALAFITFVLVLTFGLLPAIVAGIVLSTLYLIYRVSFPGGAELGRDDATGRYEAIAWQHGRRRHPTDSHAKPVPGVTIYRFSGPLVFSSAEAFKSTGEALLIEAGTQSALPHTMVIDFEEVAFVDTTGATALTDLFAYAQRYGIDLLLAHVHADTRRLLHLAGAVDEIGAHRIYGTVRHAVDAATAPPAGSRTGDKKH